MSKCSNGVATPVCSAYNGHYAVSDADCKLVEEKFTSTNTARDEIFSVSPCDYCIYERKSDYCEDCADYCLFAGKKLSPVAYDVVVHAAQEQIL